MASKPAPDKEILARGKLVALARESTRNPSAANVQRWVSLIAEQSRAQVAWEYSGGRVCVVHLGDAASYQRVVDALRAHNGRLALHVISIEPFSAS